MDVTKLKKCSGNNLFSSVRIFENGKLGPCQSSAVIILKNKASICLLLFSPFPSKGRARGLISPKSLLPNLKMLLQKLG